MEDPVDKVVVSDKKLRAIAKVAHNINDAYRIAIGEAPRGPFDDQNMEFQAATLIGVINHMMNPGGVDPQSSHELWMTHKLKDGWKYGPEFSEEQKTHPNLLPYSQLPETQRIKDYLFSAVVESLRGW